MASFSSDVKNELARADCSEGERRVELAGLLQIGGFITLGADHQTGLSFSTENAAVARRAVVLMKDCGANSPEVSVRRGCRLKMTNRYFIKLPPSSAARKIIMAIGLMPDTSVKLASDAERSSYVRGAFLAGGSVSRPSAPSHLEFVTESYSAADFLTSILCGMDFPAAMTERKDSYVVYIKENDAVTGILTTMGAESAALAFESAKNVKEVRNQVNRLINFETANMNKTADAAARQIDAIRRLSQSGVLPSLPAPLRATAETRLSHPEATLAELASLLAVSRSCVNHRLRKLSAIDSSQ